jgi:hypothetical protein
MHIHPNATYDYVAQKVVSMIWVVATIIDCNISLHGNNHDYCNKQKNHCKVLLQCYYLQPFLTKVTLSLLEGIATKMTLLQPYFTVAIDQFSSSKDWGLVSMSKYWTYRSHVSDMGPVSLVSGRQQSVALPPLLQWLARERNWVRTRGSVGRRVVDCVGSPFYQEQWLCPSLLMTSWKVTTYGDHPQEAYTGRTWTGVGSVYVVLVELSPTGCTSIRITATLRYEYPLIHGCHQVVIYWINK